MGNTQGVEHIENGESSTGSNPETRILSKMNDPRSPSEGITRTPIEVICTPKSTEGVQGTTLKFDTSLHDKMDTDEEPEGEKTISDGVPATKRQYRETDIDAISITSGSVQHPRVKELRTKVDLLHSKKLSLPSELPSVESLSSRIDRVSFSHNSVDDLSVAVPDCEVAAENDYTPVHDWLITIEDEHRSMSFESREECLLREDVEYDRNSIIKEKPFLTPNNRKSKKVRRPLSCLTQNTISEPIKNGLEMKAWRGINEERVRRGLSLRHENTPHLPPPLDKTSSAPGKLMRRRRLMD